MKLVVVSAGLSVPSSTRLLGDRLANATAERTPADVQVVELRDLAVEIAHNFTTGFPGPALGAALDAVTSADGLIVVTPVFSASYSGLFKSFFDVLDPDALTGKPVLVAATGGRPVIRWSWSTRCGRCSRICGPWSCPPGCTRLRRTGGPRGSLSGSTGPRGSWRG